jgi:hypothetical protein
VNFFPIPDGQKWVGKRLSFIVSADDIKKIILIEAVTTAPPGVNIFNIFKIFQGNAVFYQLDGKYPDINAIYKAIIVAKDNQVFQVEIGGGPDGRGVARLISETGIYGYFR